MIQTKKNYNKIVDNRALLCVDIIMKKRKPEKNRQQYGELF